MAFIVYKTTNKINGKFYIGVHKEKTYPKLDSYLGSGKGLKRAIQQYGVENFEKEVLHVFDDVEAAYEKETELVLEVYKTPNCYNMRPGGRGIRNIRINNHSEAWRKHQSKVMTGKKASDETRAKLSKIDKSYMKTPEYRKAVSEGRRLGKIMRLRNLDLNPGVVPPVAE